ncbi:MAG: ATP-binding protein [Oscillospiraceae bacterium]|nr:ATP-binding protein [Oscillospiraceae bacterium]
MKKEKTVKFVLSVASGWLSVLLTQFAIPVDTLYNMKINWGLIFPIIIAKSWGIGYAMAAVTLGGFFLVPFVAEQSYGNGNFLCSFFYVCFVLMIGYFFCENGKKKDSHIYLTLSIYSVVYFIVVNGLFSMIIATNSEGYVRFMSSTIIRTKTLNEILTFVALAVLAKILLRIPTVRALFRVPKLQYAEKNSRIVFTVITVFATYLFIDKLVDDFFFNGRGIRISVLSNQTGYMLKSVMVFTVVLIICDYIISNSMKTMKSSEELARSEERYRMVFNNMIDTHIEIDEQGIITCSTPSVMNTLGYTQVYVVGKPLRMFFEDMEKVDGFVEKLFESRSTGNVELVSSYPYQHHQLLVFGKAIQPTGVACSIGVITVRDISDYKNADKKRREFSALTNAIFESNRDLIWVVSGNDFRLMSCNIAFKKYVERTTGNKVDINDSIECCFTEKESEQLKEYYRKVLEIGNFFAEFTTEKEQLILDLSFYPVKVSTDVINISVFAKNMTQQREAENQIVALNEGLEQMVSERTRALTEAYSDLESFSYTVTHEFKTPVREIDTYMSIIEEDNRGRLLEESVEDIHSVRRVCAETLEMTEKMMIYAKAGYMVLNIEEINMEQLVRNCFNEIAISHDIESSLEIYNLAPLDADAFMIRVAVTNILSNSFKFSQKKGKVSITVGCMRNNEEKTYYFRDNGVGFKTHNSDNLFGLFNRAHNKCEYEGSGIGLASVKRICVRNGGDAAIYGEKDNGCVVLLSFKRKEKQ